MENKVTVEDKLEKAGLTKMAESIRRMKIQKSKMTTAYEHYRYVRPEKFKQFNERLLKETQKNNQWGGINYDRLRFTALESYGKIPPMNVLDSLEKANDLGCFDRFEVADIESVQELPDPIVFGIIEGCSDKFFIDQWDDDVKIEDILNENEG